MLILDQDFGVPAFATSGNPTWKAAPSRDGIEDAIHHNGRFYSISNSGAVEAWDEQNGGEFTSTFVAPARTMPVIMDFDLDHKYLVPDGRLAVVLKYVSVQPGRYRVPRKWSCRFKVQVLGNGGRWKETREIRDAALFVGINSSLCVSTTALAHQGGIKAGCVYFADDELRQAPKRRERIVKGYGLPSNDGDDDQPQLMDPEHVAIYSLKDDTVEQVQGLGPQPWTSPPVWITPSV